MPTPPNSGGQVKSLADAHSSPRGASDRRYCTIVARTTVTPSCMISHSELRTRRPSLIRATFVVVGTPRAALNRSTVSRAGMNSGSPNLASKARAARPTSAGPLR